MFQTIMVIGSFMILSLLTASVNNAIINKTVDTYQSEAFIAATALGEGLIKEISLRDFDEKTVGVAIDSVQQLTYAISLGKDGGETTSATFDDIDDYKGYSRYDSLANGIFKSTVDVTYLNPVTLDSSAVPTFYKRITVTVYDP